MRKTALAVWLVVTTAAFGCNVVKGSGKLETQERQVPQYTGLDISGGYKVKVTIDPKLAGSSPVILTGDDNILPRIETVTTNGVLHVGSNEGVWPELPLSLETTTSALVSMDLSGSVDGTVVGLAGEKFVLDLSGSGSIGLEGSVGALVLEVSGSGSINAQNLKAQEVSIDVAGSGNIVVCASKKLRVDISGSGKVEYHCNPAEVVQDIAGSGELIKK